MLWVHIGPAMINLDHAEYVNYGDKAKTTVELGLSSGQKATISKDGAGAFNASDIITAITGLTSGLDISPHGSNVKVIVQ